MRLTGFEPLPDLKPVGTRMRPALGPWLERARSVGERLRPHVDRLGKEVRKHPKLAAGFDHVATVWTKLVASFCETIDPYLSRFFPDMRLVATVTASGDVELHKVVKGATTFIGSPAIVGLPEKAEIERTKWTAIELRLRPDQVLHRTLSLPAASRDFLGPIIEHRLERLTPWRPEGVLYGYRVLDTAEAGGTVTIALTATSKEVVAAPLRALADIGLAPTAVGAREGPLETPLLVNFFRGGAKFARTDSRAMVSRVALASFGALAVLYLASSFWASGAASRQEEAATRLMKARRLLKAASMGNVGSREQALLAAKQTDKAMVVLVDKLATAIPQDTYLKELDVTPDKVRLVGVSSNAPALVGELEATGLMNVRFTSAVTREKDQKDSFEITADRAAPSVAEAR